MRRAMVVIVAVVVVLIIAIAYLGIVGMADKQDPVGPDDDPTDEGRDPIAVGNLYLEMNIHNPIGGSGHIGIDAFYADVHSWTGQSLSVYWNQKFDPLGLFGGNTYTVKIKATVTGPSGWTASWEPSSFEWKCGEGDHHTLTKESGPMKFWDAGTYNGSVEVYLDDAIGATATITFSVS